jgi:hypothetical protein
MSTTVTAPATPTMIITLRKVQHAAFASEETQCFSADIYVDGKKRGSAANEGHGGPTHIEPRALAEELDAYAATLPRITSTNIKDETDPTGYFTYDQTGETLVDDLLAEHLIEKDVKKAMAKRILYTAKDKPGIFQTKAVKASVLKTWLATPDLAAKLKADKVLNLLPLEEAIALYKASATG